jgi:hypothetical protein
MELIDYVRFEEQRFPVAQSLARDYMRRVSRGYDRMYEAKVTLVGLARNVAHILPATMLRMESLGRTFRDYNVVIYENDSVDSTALTLQRWQASNRRVTILSEKLGAPPSVTSRCARRADRMAFYRSQCQAHVRKYHSQNEFVILVDTDVEGGWSADGIASTFGSDSWDFVGSNGVIYKRKGWHANATVQYDAWAYREHADFRPLTTRFVNNKTFYRGQPLIPLPSCFGGLGVYRTEAYLAGTYCGPDIEHVAFHRSIRELGYDATFLNPSQIVVYGRKDRCLDPWVKRLHQLTHRMCLHRRIPWRYETSIEFGKFRPHFEAESLNENGSTAFSSNRSA